MYFCTTFLQFLFFTMYTSKNIGSKVLTFKHFSRKGWALFSCMGREVRIGVLGVATLATAAPRLSANSIIEITEHRTETPDTLELGVATVTASRAPLTADQAARQVMTLTREDIAAAGVTSINDVLKLAAGVDVRQRGGFGIQSDVCIDGGTFDQLTILVNGMPFNNPQTGHNAAIFPVNLNDIERIEVLEGAASRVFGTQAFSGAINIVTKSTDHPVNLGVQTGSYGTVRTDARLTGKWKSFVSSVSASYQRSDGAVDNGDFEGSKLFWQGNFLNDEIRLNAQAGISTDNFGANTFYNPANNRQWEATRRYHIGLSAETNGTIHFAPSFSWIRSTDHYQWIRHTHDYENFNRTDVFTLGLNAWTHWMLGKISVGAEFREEDLLSRNLGHDMPPHQWTRIPGQDSLKYTKKDARTNLSCFFEHNVILSQWTVSFGLMAERNNAIDHKIRFYPGIDVSYRPHKQWRFYASWNKSLRLPTFTDLWYKSVAQEGNAGLHPEKNSSFRLGMNYKTEWVDASLKMYYNHGTDMIDWVMYDATDAYHAANFQLDNIGVSLNATLDFNHLLGNNQPLKRLTLAYAYISQNRRDEMPIFKSNYAMEYLRHKFVATLSHGIFKEFSANWTLRIQNRNGYYQVYENLRPTDVLKNYGTHALLDCKLIWQKKHVELFADLTNLTAKRYYDIAGVRQPGFLIMLGGNVKF